MISSQGAPDYFSSKRLGIGVGFGGESFFTARLCPAHLALSDLHFFRRLPYFDNGSSGDLSGGPEAELESDGKGLRNWSAPAIPPLSIRDHLVFGRTTALGLHPLHRPTLPAIPRGEPRALRNDVATTPSTVSLLTRRRTLRRDHRTRTLSGLRSRPLLRRPTPPVHLVSSVACWHRSPLPSTSAA